MAKKNSQLVHNEDGSITVKLKFPIEHSKQSFTEVKLRGEATAGDLESMDDGKGDMHKTLCLIQELSGVSIGALRKMRSVDYAALSEAVAEILGKDQ
jgi:hypothetical protein